MFVLKKMRKAFRWDWHVKRVPYFKYFDANIIILGFGFKWKWNKHFDDFEVVEISHDITHCKIQTWLLMLLYIFKTSQMYRASVASHYEDIHSFARYVCSELKLAPDADSLISCKLSYTIAQFIHSRIVLTCGQTPQVSFCVLSSDEQIEKSQQNKKRKK